MATQDDNKKPSIFNLFICKCPRCRKGNMFKTTNPYNLKNFMQMNETCPVCGQVFDIEVGFYYGTSYVSYAFAVALSAATFVAWWLLIGISVNDNRVFYWLGFNSVLLLALQPPMMRVARTIWLSFFVYYDKNWKTKEAKKPERTNDAMKNAW